MNLENISQVIEPFAFHDGRHMRKIYSDNDVGKWCFVSRLWHDDDNVHKLQLVVIYYLKSAPRLKVIKTLKINIYIKQCVLDILEHKSLWCSYFVCHMHMPLANNAVILCGNGL